MTRQRTLREYRLIDLTLFAVMLAVCETLIVKAAVFWFRDQLFTVSLAGAVTSIVYMRWGWWGCIHAFLAGLVYCLASNAGMDTTLIYCLGNLLSCLSVWPLLKIGKERVRTGNLCCVYPLFVLLLMQAGRALAAVIIKGVPFADTVGFFTTDSLSMLFTFVLVWIAHRLDGVYEDQIHYLLRLSAKERTEKGGS